LTKYWRGNGSKIGMCGSMDDDGFVPDSDEISKEEYQAWVNAQPVVPKKDYKDLLLKAATTTEKIDILAEAIGIKS
jgi:hypothetical protein